MRPKRQGQAEIANPLYMDVRRRICNRAPYFTCIIFPAWRRRAAR